jgi:hypothetical protein
MSTEPSYFNAYENFSLTRTAAGVLTVRLHTNGRPITFTGATHSQFPRVLEDIAFDRDNQVMVLTGTGDSFMAAIDGPSLGDLTKPMGADVEYMEGRRIVQRLVDLEMPIVAAVNGSASAHSEYAPPRRRCHRQRYHRLQRLPASRVRDRARRRHAHRLGRGAPPEPGATPQ